MPDLRFFPSNLPIHADRSNDHGGIKRLLELTNARAPSGETVWTGSSVDDVRKLTLDFVGTNLSKDLINFKPLAVSAGNDLSRAVIFLFFS